MKKFFNKKFLILFSVFLGIIFVVLPTRAAIVTCDKCTLCDLFVVGKNIIDFLWWQISFPLAVLMLALAAFFFIISGGNAGTHTKAKAIATSAVVGLFITFGAWLMVSTVINLIANTGAFPWPWNKPTCTAPTSPSGYTCVSPNGCTTLNICRAEGRVVSGYTCATGSVCCSFSE